MVRDGYDLCPARQPGNADQGECKQKHGGGDEPKLPVAEVFKDQFGGDECKKRVGDRLQLGASPARFSESRGQSGSAQDQGVG